ncbi:MAG: AAA family ATPase [Bacillota bacterium]
MGIRSIKVSNFKVFRELDLEMQYYNVFIGANASGKSSFVYIFKFLHNVQKEGLKNAVSMAGGIEYLRNLNIGSDAPLSLSITVDDFSRKKHKIGSKETILRKTDRLTYQFKLDFSASDLKYEVISDRLSVDMSFYQETGKKTLVPRGTARVQIFRKNGKPELEIKKDNIQFSDQFLNKNMILPSFLNDYQIDPQETILETPLPFIIEPELKRMLGSIAIYNINPSRCRKSSSAGERMVLEEDGSNLAVILREIIANEENRKKFMNLINEVLPFIKTMAVEKYADKSLFLQLEEKYMENKKIPVGLFSDGTISITALIIALYFEKNSIILIEELERNVHPHLISRLVEMVKEVSSFRQIITTTHNPELIKYINLENLFLVHRGTKGYSEITRPVEKEEIRTFLDTDMGIDELYIQNLLEV